jgi:hypothetical protein
VVLCDLVYITLMCVCVFSLKALQAKCQHIGQNISAHQHTVVAPHGVRSAAYSMHLDVLLVLCRLSQQEQSPASDPGARMCLRIWLHCLADAAASCCSRLLPLDQPLSSLAAFKSALLPLDQPLYLTDLWLC